jgi:GntR family transcriptional regulator of vanillate catabolism
MPNQQENVYRRILEDLEAGRWKSGQRLSELKLAKELNVKRSPVREALFRLASEGFLEREPGFGCHVPHWDLESLEEIAQLREGLEGMAARLAAARVTDPELIRLEQELLVMEHLLTSREASDYCDGDAYWESDARFHRQLVELSGNNWILRSWQRAHILVRSFRQFYTNWAAQPNPALPHGPQVVMKAHRRILEALKKRDPDEAEAAARKHIQTAVEQARGLALRLQGKGAERGEESGKSAVDEEVVTTI